MPASESSSGGGWPASRIETLRRSGAIVTMQSVVNIHDEVALVDVHELQRRQQLLGVAAAEHERAPRDPQADAERRRVRPVARDVADHRVHGAVAVLDGVVEVAAQQRAPAARAVVRA